MHRRLLSARLNLQVSERTVIKSVNRVQEWRKSIVDTERKRLRKTILDLCVCRLKYWEQPLTMRGSRESNRQLSSLTDWKLPLLTERGLWCRLHQTRLWRLDETEGSFRVRYISLLVTLNMHLPLSRKKLEPQNEESLVQRTVGMANERFVEQEDQDARSVVQMELPPWVEGYDLSAIEAEGTSLTSCSHHVLKLALRFQRTAS